MSKEMQTSLGYEGKLDRSPKNLDRLIAHGEECGRAFWAARGTGGGSSCIICCNRA